MIIITKNTSDKFNGVKFEQDNNCVVYKIDDLTYFVSATEFNDLDNLIEKNVEKNNVEINF